MRSFRHVHPRRADCPRRQRYGSVAASGRAGLSCRCEAVTFNRTAAEFDFSYSGIDFDAAFTIDIRGRMVVRSVVRLFQTVRVQATVYTDKSEAHLRRVVKETEARCPLFNLINDAKVRVEIRWVRRPNGARATAAS
ncbi:MAG: OsmC family protein [Hyphomicrobiaceae bacterium]